MYCTKCGKEARAGDVYCSGCGSKLSGGNKKGKGWLLVILCIAAVGTAGGILASRQEPAKVAPVDTFPTVNYRELPELEMPVINENEMLPEQPKDGDVLEDSFYSNGSPRREVTDSYGTVYVYDYRPDGTLLRETWLCYSNDVFSHIRVTNCDDHGNPLDTTETMADGELWLYLYYRNTYDEQGRPLMLAEYNRMSYPLCIYEYTYNADGSYTQVCTEYRGFVYEYDLEYNRMGTTSVFCRSTTTFNAQGDVIDQYFEDL